MSAKLRWTCDTSEVDNELDRLDDGFDYGDQLRLAAILSGLFQETQFLVHVQTGSLRASGTHDADYREKEWTGEIAYGGEAHGFRYDPVFYAHHERDRDGDHDFLRPVYDGDPLYTQAILEFLDGGAL